MVLEFSLQEENPEESGHNSYTLRKEKACNPRILHPARRSFLLPEEKKIFNNYRCHSNTSPKEKRSFTIFATVYVVLNRGLAKEIVVHSQDGVLGS